MPNGFTRELATRDFEEARAVLSSSYSPHDLIITGERAAFGAHHARGTLMGMSAHVLRYDTDVRAEVDPLRDYVLLSQVRRGRFRVSAAAGARELGPGQTVALDPNTVYRMDFLDECEMLQLRIEMSSWRRAQADLCGVADPRAIRFDIAEAPTPDMESRRQAVLGLVVNEAVPQHWAERSPLLSSQLVRLCVAALLETTAATEARKPDARPASRAVRDAMDYLTAHAGEDIGLADVANAVSLSPRALQHAFKRQVGTSPLGALREIRMEKAHADLRRRSPQDTSVTEVAMCWGFANLGRFALEYRRRFGRSPSEVLRS
jgi:AraC-like DNA-binding protein